MKKMWKKTAITALVTAAFAVIAACGSSPASGGSSQEQSSRPGNQAQLPVDTSGRPDWVLNPPDDEELIYGMGSAVSTNESRGWRMAENRARMSISYQITAIIKGMQVDYTNQAGTDSNETGLNFFEDVGRQLTASVLNGARIARRGQGTNGTYYVLVSYSQATVKRSISNQVGSTAAKQARVDANAALKAMDAAFAALDKPELVETGGE
jgi:hypothetical protein